MKITRLMTALAALCVAFPAYAEEVTLTGAVFTSVDTVHGQPFKIFVDHVNEIGKGELNIRIVGPEAIPAVEQANAMRSGLIDMIANPPGFYRSMMGEANAQDISPLTLEEMRASGAYDALDKLAREKVGGHMLTTFGGVNFHIFLSKDISAIDELKGLRVRSQPIFNPFFSSLGISPVVMPIPDVYQALEKGVIQGYGFPMWGIQDFGWNQLTKVRVDPGFYTSTANVLINNARYDSLSDTQKKILDDSVVWFEKEMKEFERKANEENEKVQKDAGIRVVDFGPEFPANAVSIYWAELEKENPDTIPALRKLLSK